VLKPVSFSPLGELNTKLSLRVSGGCNVYKLYFANVWGLGSSDLLADLRSLDEEALLLTAL
jgi:hypothetical protein